eukprot:SAG31_NODE_3129_length_4646_cov_2.581262_8_plen_75_part_00
MAAVPGSVLRQLYSKLQAMFFKKSVLQAGTGYPLRAGVREYLARYRCTRPPAQCYSGNANGISVKVTAVPTVGT